MPLSFQGIAFKKHRFGRYTHGCQRRHAVEKCFAQMRLRPNKGGAEFHPFAHGNHNVSQQHLQPLRHAGCKHGGSIIIVLGVGVAGGEYLRQALPLLGLDVGLV